MGDTAQGTGGAVLAVLVFTAFFNGCGERGRGAWETSSARHTRFLYRSAADSFLGAESRFTAVNTLVSFLARAGDTPRLLLFLTEYTEKNPDDPFYCYWLLLTAYAYLENAAAPIARYYFDRIVREKDDLVVKEESVHFRCLQQLLTLSTDSAERIFYYNELLKNFSDQVNPGELSFKIGTEYEKLGDYDSAGRFYAAYLARPDAPTLRVSGYLDPFSYARKFTGMMALGGDAKQWTFATLDEITGAVQTALTEHSYYTLDSYKSRVNFFAMSWKQSESDHNATRAFYLRNFMSGRTIHYDAAADSSSRPGEVYLRTWGWSQQSTSWYFVFRRVHAPANPEVHGRWEWAGIYYGERF